MKCYVINLDRSHDRLESIKLQMAALDIEFERVRAVQIGEFSSDIACPSLHPGEVACFLSHRKCWELVASGTEDFSVVFEDDVLLSNEAGNFLKSSDWVPNNAVLVKIETFRHQIFMRRYGAAKAHNRDVKILASWHACSAGYVVAKKMAQKLLNDTDGYIEHPVDYLLFDWDLGQIRERRVFQLDPALCIQSDLIDKNAGILKSTIDRTKGAVTKRSKAHFTIAQKVKREVVRLLSRLGNFIVRRNRVVCQVKAVEME